jgi:hypothetical protein
MVVLSWGWALSLMEQFIGSHLRDGTRLLATHSQILPKLSAVLNRVPLSASRTLYMAKFAIGDVVKKDKGGSGVVRAIFTTMAGDLCYAVEHEGALDFVEEARLLASPKTDLAA